MGHVVIENLVKNYVGKDGAEIRAVNQINLSIEDGEFMVLVGPSGCGKTTTLRMPNQPITVAFDLAHALFFDEKTEAILD